MCLWSVLSVFLLGLPCQPGVAASPLRAAPFYSLPSEGAWVEFAWTQQRLAGKPLKGTLRISSVGATEVRGERHRWVEIRLEIDLPAGKQRTVRKLLLAEGKFRNQRPLADCVAACLEKLPDTGLEANLSAKRTHEFLSMGLGEGANLREVNALARLETKLGAFTTRHVATQKDAWTIGAEQGPAPARTVKVRSGLPTRLEYEAWLSNRIPFGCARFLIREAAADGTSRVIHEATVVRFSAGVTVAGTQAR